MLYIPGRIACLHINSLAAFYTVGARDSATPTPSGSSRGKVSLSFLNSQVGRYSSCIVRVNSTGKVCLVYAFFAPWVNISAAQTVKHTAEKNRKEAKEFAEKLKREKYLLY